MPNNVIIDISMNMRLPGHYNDIIRHIQSEWFRPICIMALLHTNIEDIEDTHSK
jgi:hypothetical protein